ncbi:MAG: hypothetical protein DCC56_09515 [Anaerolineae bacterium]|nr:MAG: hypothetical protein DCC56_09515 [Anaerolineae bacterium]WKZ45174.1 MAG: hypothetical protein QY302_05225 [Anaerolineales bacterium]
MNQTTWNALSDLQSQFCKLLGKDMEKIFSNLSTLQTHCIEANYTDLPDEAHRATREIISETKRMIRLERWARG